MVDEFAGGQTFKPYNSSKLLNEKVDKQGTLSVLYLRHNKTPAADEIKNARHDEIDYKLSTRANLRRSEYELSPKSE